MKAIIFADRTGEELLPLTDRTCVALLPVAAKPMIEYALDALLMANILETIIVMSPYAEQIEHTLEAGERWGIALNYQLSLGQENPADFLARLGESLVEDEYVLLRADILFSFNLLEFVNRCKELSTDLVIAQSANGQSAGVCFVRTVEKLKICSEFLDWPVLQANTLPTACATVTPEKADCFLMDSWQAYFDTNFAVAKGEYPALVLPGRQINRKLRAGRRSKVFGKSSAFVGDYCYVDLKASLEPTVIISDEVIVDRYAVLRNTLVLPDTYIGEAVELERAIVWGNLLIRVDSQTVLYVWDSFLMTDLYQVRFTKLAAGFINRSLGSLLFLLSLPLWLIAALTALIENPRHPWQKVLLFGNLYQLDEQGTAHFCLLNTYEWGTSIPILRHLPKLIAVIRGQIRLIGVTPELPEERAMRQAPWEKVRDHAVVGLWGIRQLVVPVDAPWEEKLIAEAYYVQTHSIIKDIGWLLRAGWTFFTPRAWWPVKKNQ